ncbi:hypothetical protein EJB05_32541 [Eragrostis curvula]|uniref:Protein SCAR n=1 Tax=Eragrostis curvula TaxID=38414 RepID=A0A5J9UHU2_9POAL|nr:hypothetical protein EJB05_32541 [Eragrostis curvula]
MPLVRFEVRNEVGLGDPGLYGGPAAAAAAAAGKKGAGAEEEEPKALLEGVAVAGLVGILRQLGDLADGGIRFCYRGSSVRTELDSAKVSRFGNGIWRYVLDCLVDSWVHLGLGIECACSIRFAADVFHDLHEQVIATSARGRRVLTRVQNIEAALPSLEKAVKNQKSHIHFAYVPGSDWHTQLQNEQNHLLSSDLPRFMMDSYEECRDPPRLYLLDKFDNAGAGACLKRYSDPSYFKKAWDMMSADKNANLKREKRSQKIKRKGSRLREPYPGQTISRHRSGELQRSRTAVQLTNRQFASPSTDGQSFSEHRSTPDAVSNPDNISRSSSFSSKARLSFVEQVLDTKPSAVPHENGHEKSSNVKMQKRSVSLSPALLNGTSVKESSDSLKQTSLPDDMVARPPSVKWDEKSAIIMSTSSVYCDDVVMDKADDSEPNHISLGQKGIGHREIDTLVQQEPSLQKTKLSLLSSGLNHHDDIPGEADNYLDALNTLESETETEPEVQTKSQVISAPSFNALAPQVDTVDNIVSQHPDSSVSEFPDTCQDADLTCTSEILGLSNADPLEVSQVADSDHTAAFPKTGSSDINNVHESDGEGSYGDPSDISEPESQVHIAVPPDQGSLVSDIVSESKAEDGPGDFPKISGPGLSACAVIHSIKESSGANQIVDSNTGEVTNYMGSGPTSSDTLTDMPFQKAFSDASSPDGTTGDSYVVSESKNTPQDDPGRNLDKASEVSDFQSEPFNEPLDNRCATVDIPTNSCSTSVGSSSVKLWTNAGLFGLEPSKPPVFGAQDGPRENSPPDSKELQQGLSSDYAGLHSANPTESAVVDVSNGNTSITTSFVGKLVGIRPGSANSNSSGANQLAARTPDSVHSQTDGHSDCSSSFEHNEHKNSIGKHTSISELLESEENAENGAGTYSSTDIDGRNNMHMVSASSFSSIAQRFLANTLQRRASPKYNDIATSARTNTDASANDQSTLNHVVERSETVFKESQFEKNAENGMNGLSKSSIFSSRRYSEKSSPPLEYMKISFHPMSSFETSKMNLDLCDGSLNDNSDDMMLPTFQLLSEVSVPQPGSGSESEDDTFGRSYSYSSYDDLSPRLYSNSEVWDHEDGVGLEEHELYDDSNQSAAPISSYMEFEQMNLSGIKSTMSLPEIGDQDALGTLEPHTVEELPNFDTLIPRSDNQNGEISIPHNPVNLPLDEDQLPPPPPLPPMQWRMMKQTTSLEEEKGTPAKDMFRKPSSLPHVDTSAQEEHHPPDASPDTQGHAKEVSEQLRLNGHEKSKDVGSNIKNLDEREELLQQIRSKTFNLRRTNASKTDTSSQSTANSNVVAILEKANAIRQAVASEDGCDDDNWSDI